MSPEQVLLLQVLRRAKRQHDLTIEVQKNLKSLMNIQKGIQKTAEQVKQLHSILKDSQKKDSASTAPHLRSRANAGKRIRKAENSKTRGRNNDSR